MRNRLSVLGTFACLLLAGCSSGATSNDAAPKKSETTDASAPGSDAGSSVDAGEDAGPSPLLIEPDQGMQRLYDFVSSAQKTIDMTMYELVDTTMTNLLTQAAKNGVTVRVILDQNLEQTDNTPAYDALGAANVQVHWADTAYAATHQKTITIDGTTSAVMSLNLAASEYSTSRDFAVFTSDANDVAAIEATFQADFTNDISFSASGADNLVWSPRQSQVDLLAMINGAKASLLVENEEMGDANVVSALVSAAQRGVAVHICMENSTSYASEFSELVAAGVKLTTYEHAKLYIHAKVIVADYGTSNASVFVGSENFSVSSLTLNRELGITTSDPVIMDPVNATLTSDFNGGTPYAGSPSDAGGQ